MLPNIFPGGPLLPTCFFPVLTCALLVSPSNHPVPLWHPPVFPQYSVSAHAVQGVAAGCPCSSKAEMRHTCRGTINLATANITVEDSCNFIISNGGAQTYHLKASSEVERQRWVTALELAKAKAVKMLEESGSA